jgi:glutamate---cysteine ligase / carboxylate-amine ligase
MAALEFTHNDYPSLGVEIELQIIDAETLALSNSITEIMARLPRDLINKVKPELTQSSLEINTDVCRTVQDVRNDLRRKLEAVENIIDPLGLKLFWSATHPFSSWRAQSITPNPRYHRLVELMQDVARRLNTFGLHVHVGVDTGDKAVMICDRLLRHLPLLLALSGNSPFWEGRNTGLHSNRAIIMEGLPTAGLPHPMRNWSEYVWLVNHLIRTGFINSIREIWWDIRPHHSFGTVEIRVCDLPANLEHVLSLTAFIQCLVHATSKKIEEGTYQYEYHPMMVRQNKWRAARYGAAARLVNTDDYERYSVQETVDRLIEPLLPVAHQFQCAAELEALARLPAQTGSQQQIEIYERAQSKEEVVRQMLAVHHWRSLPVPALTPAS